MEQRPQFKISPKIIPSISSLYNDPNRIFMEYIDNSIDSSEDFFDKSTNSYSRPIEIIIRFDGKNYKTAKVSVSDNCCGITNFFKIIESVGDSDKKSQAWTNGQFGFGIYSFMAACQKLEIKSKTKDDKKTKDIIIDREKFNVKNVEDVEFEEIKEIEKFPYETGTTIELSLFEKDKWKEINIKTLKEEIERHFELILSRKNLNIRILDIDKGESKKYECIPFDYSIINGNDYTKSVAIETKSIIGETAKNIDIYIKFSNEKILNRPVVFISKGRRIGSVKDMVAFKSKHKNDIWNHPNITGYIDVKDLLDPTIARTDFKNTENSKKIFEVLTELESSEILDFINKIKIKSEERHYKNLENILNNVLSSLAKQDRMNFRKDIESSIDNGEKIDENEFGNFGISVFDDEPHDHFGKRQENDTSEDIFDWKDKDFNKNDEKNNDFSFNDDTSNIKEKRKSGFNIRIVDMEPLLDNKDKLQRSILIDGEIRIFKKHPDFEERVKESANGEKKISERLITYLAGEVTVHYKDEFFKKNMQQPEYDKELFKDLVEFIYKFEKELSSLNGKNLSDI